VTDYTQVIVPFYDEPVFYVYNNTNGSALAATWAYLLGFVRNV
jgi:hypothetical protein